MPLGASAARSGSSVGRRGRLFGYLDGTPRGYPPLPPGAQLLDARRPDGRARKRHMKWGNEAEVRKPDVRGA